MEEGGKMRQEGGEQQQGELPPEGVMEDTRDQLDILTIKVKPKMKLPDNQIDKVKGGMDKSVAGKKTEKAEDKSDVLRKGVKRTEEKGSEKKEQTEREKILEQRSMIDVTRDEVFFLLSHGRAKKLQTRHGVCIDVCGEVTDRRRVAVSGEEGRRARAEEEVRRILDEFTSIEVSRNCAGLLLRDGKATELGKKYGVHICNREKWIRPK